jgi:hypothetical protein
MGISIVPGIPNRVIGGYTEAINVCAYPYNAKGDGATDDTAAVQAAIRAANAVAGGNTGVGKGQRACIVYFPPGTYLLSGQLNPYPGVTLAGAGIFASVLMFGMSDAIDAIVFDRNAVGYPLADFGGYGYGGALRDLKVTSRDYNSAAGACNRMVKLVGLVEFDMENVYLYQSRGRLLHIEDCISMTLDHVSAHQSKGDYGVWIGTGGGSITTTVRAFNLYVDQCENGPNVSVGGLSCDFYGLISESAGAPTFPAGAYGIEIRSGRVGLYSPYFEDNADNDVHVGSDVVAGVTAVVVSNIMALNAVGTKRAGTGGIYLDNVASSEIIGGDLSPVQKPLRMTPNCGRVMASFYAPGKVPELTSGAHWRTKLDFNYMTGANRNLQTVQRLEKNGIAPAGTAVLTIPVDPSGKPSYVQVYARVQFDAGANLQATARIDASHESDGFADGGGVVQIIHNNTAGNFVVAAGNFVVTFGANSIIITYTCANLAGQTNTIAFDVIGVGVMGDISLA